MGFITTGLNTCINFNLALLGSCLLLSIQPSYADVIPDQTLGAESSRLRTETDAADVDTTFIESGATRGDALFHSFSTLDVDANQRVFFAPSPTITNIFSRVTGGAASEINGTLGVNGAANLFLLNPQGIIFGPDAVLDLSGSFLATTADSFDWGNGLTFSAINPDPAPSLLDLQIKPGLQYGQNNQGSLVSQANLVTNAPLELASQTLNLSGSITTNGNDVTLQGSDITLTGMKLTSSISTEPPSTEALSQGNSGNVTLNGNNIKILDGSTITTRLNQNVEGRAGDVRIDADRLEMRQDSQIQAETIGQGDAGNVTLNVPGEIIFTDRSEIDVRNAELRFRPEFVFIPGNGDAGRIVVNGGSMVLDNAPLWAQLLSVGTGKGISINLTGDLKIDGRTTSSGFFTGARDRAVAPPNKGAGPLFVKARNIEMMGAAARIQGGTLGDALGGTVTVEVENKLSLTGNARILSSAEAGAKRDASNMLVTARRIELLDRAIFESATRADVEAGDITIVTDELLMDNQGQIVSSTTEKGNAGTIDITAKQSLDIFKDSVIYSGVDGGTGNGGNILITAGYLRLRDGGRIEAQTEANLPNLIAESLQGDSYDDVIRRSNPVAYWKFDEENSDRVSDSGTSGRFSGIYEGGPVGSSTDAVSGRAAQFDGDGPGGIIRVDPEIGLDQTSFLLEAWVKPDPEAPDQQVLFSTIDESSDRRGFSFRINADESSDTLLDVGGSFKEEGLPLDGQWHHIVARVNYNPNSTERDAISITNYLDGKQIRGGPRGGLRFEEETTRIGGLLGPDSLPFKGLVDEVAIYRNDELPIRGALPVETHYIAGRLSLDPDFVAESSGEAIAGNITINANNIDISGVSLTPTGDLGTRGRDFRGISSGIFSGSETEFSGRGGNITVMAKDTLNLSDAGVISALTNSLADAGNIDITANNINLDQGGQVLATSSRTGNAGDINIDAQKIAISGIDTNYQQRFDTVDDPSIRIDTNALQRSLPSGDSQNVAPSGIITSNQLGNGGNITLNPSRLLTLRDQGLIRTDSGRNGGDIIINNSNGFIVAVPDENSDITANASQGDGGNINITTQGIFGIQFRQEESPFSSDITASSEFGVNGVVDVDVLNIDPSQGLSELPSDITDPSRQIARRCSSQNVSQSSFIQSGRGGLPTNPGDPLRSRLSSDWIDLETATSTATTASPYSDAHTTYSRPAISQAIAEAGHWSVNPNGEVTLVAAGAVKTDPVHCDAYKTPQAGTADMAG